jgi:hypothetical protein
MHLNLLTEEINSLGNPVLRKKCINVSELTTLEMAEFSVQSRGYLVISTSLPCKASLEAHCKVTEYVYACFNIN